MGLQKNKYTVLIRRSKLEYAAICLELNVAARGVDLADVEKNLKSAIDTYLEDIEQNPDTLVAPIPIEELIEFLKDTEPEWVKEETLFKPLEVHEVPSYV